jgi:sec-independent protein translocase protein TatC
VTDEPLPITEHLRELRNRLIKILIGWAAGTVAAWGFKEQIFGFLVEPAVATLGPEGGKLQALAPTEIFFTYIKCALLAGFILSIPVFFWQLWAFVSPGLYRSEKRAIIPFVVCSSLLFIVGSVFGYAAVFPIMFNFFTGFDSEFVQSAWTMREVFSLTSRLFLVFGVAFELPIFVFFLSISGIVNSRQLLKGTPYAILIVFVVGAVLTPPDPVSQVLLALPMFVLYLLGVGVAWMFDEGRRRGRRKKGSDVRGDSKALQADAEAQLE